MTARLQDRKTKIESEVLSLASPAEALAKDGSHTRPVLVPPTDKSCSLMGGFFPYFLLCE
jgi:hypothetical protein